jgi:hypothetical protein
MSKKSKFTAISILGFVLSALFTIQLFLSNSTGKFEKCMMILAAIVFECSKWILLWEGFSGKHSATLKTALITLWLMVTAGSIVASCGYVLNQSNTTQNKAMVESVEYRQAEEGRKIQIDAFSAKKAEIEQLRKQADGLPLNYFTMKQNIMDKVAVKSKELSTISSQISQPIKISAPLSSNGYTAFFQMIGKMMDEEPKQLELLFFMAIGIILEAIANVFAYLAQKETNLVAVAPNIQQAHPTAEFKPKMYSPKARIPVKKNKLNVIPFVKKNETVHNFTESQAMAEFTNDDVEKFVEVMLSSEDAKKGNCPGIKKMAELLEWGRAEEEKVRSIRGILLNRGMLAKGDGATSKYRIIMKMEEVI